MDIHNWRLVPLQDIARNDLRKGKRGKPLNRFLRVHYILSSKEGLAAKTRCTMKKREGLWVVPACNERARGNRSSPR